MISRHALVLVLISILVAQVNSVRSGRGDFQSTGTSRPLRSAEPTEVGMSPARLAQIDKIIDAEIVKKQLPGAVVVVGRQGKIVWRRAYGNRALEPAREPMSVDTIFDLASLTKVVATATSMMILVERGLVRLGDPVANYIPAFAAMGKKGITVEQLLIHRSGLIADNEIKEYEQGAEKAFENIWRLAPLAEPGSKFIYSDVNFIVLAEIVRRVSGKPVDEFAEENIFRPLGMKETAYTPLKRLGEGVKTRIAPTERRGGDASVTESQAGWMRGEVHDPRAYLLGGVAGHAGLFATADDLAIYCQMILNGGEYQGARILSQPGVSRMTEARVAAGGSTDGVLRGLGWDISSGYSANRGDLFPIGSFGHTGFTGTSIWIDPSSETFVIFLSNRVHPKIDPDRPANINSLRGRVATVVAASIIAPPFVEGAGKNVSRGPRGNGSAVNGIDALARDGFKVLRGKRIGLITNQTGKDRGGRSTIDLLFNAPEVKLVALFSPEHGIRGVLDQENISNTKDEKTGLPIYSLYGETRKPASETLNEIDALVFDIQDIGARFYTYISTMWMAMEEAAKHKIGFIVLDRVNPITGEGVEGPLADADKLSFTAYHSIPVRHGMTAGELAQLFNRERNINADLTVVRVEGWKRGEWFDETGLTWINPSPNMRSLTQATLYPGICLLEPTNVSVGRGTDTPFELVGAPWIDERRLAQALNKANLPGARFVPVRFTPKTSVHKDAECGGVNVLITDRKVFEPVLAGLEIAVQLLKLFPKDFSTEKFNRLLANQNILDAFRRGSDARTLRQLWQSDLDGFRAIRSKYLLY